MNAVRQSCRPKHQVLVLKCYPKFQKNNNDFKPNSSELSYLLYYASTRRSKLQKVSEFLLKRTSSDVYKGKIGNIQVTLQIVKALIEKCPRDLPLYAGAVLRIIQTVLKSHDVSLVEESVPTFDTFCTFQDPASLAADQTFIEQYEEIVKLYSDFASQQTVKQAKNSVSWPVAVRFRKAGLDAIKSIASSDSLASETGRQLSLIIPAILYNLSSEDGGHLRILESREEEKDDHEKDQALRRRQSVSTVQTTETDEGDPAAASGTTEDADKLAELHIGVMALRALRHIFRAVNRGQLRLATIAVLQVVASRAAAKTDTDLIRSVAGRTWSSTLFTMLCEWAPVQDRYAILVAVVETLVRSPIREDDLKRQFALVNIIGSLLSSEVNLIGLSVIDVLVGLIQHILLLLQLGGHGSSLHPHHQQADVIDQLSPSKSPKSPHSVNGAMHSSTAEVEKVSEASDLRRHFLWQLKEAIASLATHVYYNDQISDMISTILVRLKPPVSASLPNAIAAIENPDGATSAIASTVNANEKTDTDSFFTFENARLVALEAIKNIILIANSRRSDGSFLSGERTSVSVTAWEGTEWLLRDPSSEVRRVYVQALVVWLEHEMDKDDLRATDYRLARKSSKNEKDNQANMIKKAMSNVSIQEKAAKMSRSSFLRLLHLAIYENVQQTASNDEETLLAHHLLENTVRYLGVNAVRTGLPMIMRLQEDSRTMTDPVLKVRASSIVLGYLWTLSVYFEFEESALGQSIHDEISKRSRDGLWMRGIKVPALSFAQMTLLLKSGDRLCTPASKQSGSQFASFDDREQILEAIEEGYSVSLMSPPNSPPGSPNKSLSKPILSGAVPQTRLPLPSDVKNDLLSEWSKEACAAKSASSNSRSASVSGSRTGNNSNSQNLLGVAVPNHRLSNLSNLEMSSPGLWQQLQKNPNLSPKHLSATGSQLSTTSFRSTVRVEDLKRALSGASRPTLSIAVHKRISRDAEDTGSESMMSADISTSDFSFSTATDKRTASPADQTQQHQNLQQPAKTHHSRAMGIPTVHEPEVDTVDDDVPPVPPLPPELKASYAAQGQSPSISQRSYTPTVEGRPSTALGTEAEETGQAHNDARKTRSLKNGLTTHYRTKSAERKLAEEGKNITGNNSNFNSSTNTGNAISNISGKSDRHAATPPRRADFSHFLNSIEVDDESSPDGAAQSLTWSPPY